ncbi:MAG: hypothetical protein IPJ48_05045 [Propionivibrio sp.]|uniref:Uncharacterized protein n=1 Tax=Candidatus Propionivibrio dominans TaxID=2954373 RepID=A0A9D7FBC1_9RHOO|nr:hypothetical protein [Candidatus Propionivibrio dominans]
MKTKHEYGNKPEHSELEEEIAEDIKFNDNNENAKAAFLIDQRHDAASGIATFDCVQAEPAVEAVLHTDFIERRDAAIIDRRNVAKINQRIDASQ